MSTLLGSKSKFPSSYRLGRGGLKFCPPEPEPNNSPRSQAYDNIFESVGNTPLVKLNQIPRDEGVDSNTIWVKCEQFNPVGSIKDRVVQSLMEEAKKDLGEDFLKQKTVLEPTSGNTGIAIAANCSVNNYKCQILTHSKISNDKMAIMQLLGAEVNIMSGDTMEHAMDLLNTGDYVMLDQFENTINPETHYKETAEEIIEALELYYTPKKITPRVDYLFCGTGSGGTVTGLGTKLKETYRRCKVIAADPHGSRLYQNQNNPDEGHPFLVEGVLGSPEAPFTLSFVIHDDFEVVTDEESFNMARDMAKKEAILCGGSSGLAVKAAIKYLKKNNIKNAIVVVILPDGIRNHMSTFVSDQWMEAHFFKDPPPLNDKWYNSKVSDLINTLPKVHLEPIVVYPDDDYRTILKKLFEPSCKDVVTHSDEVAFLMDKQNSYYIGLISKYGLRNIKTNPSEVPVCNRTPNDLVTKKVYTIPLNFLNHPNSPDWTVGLVSRMLDISDYVVLGEGDKRYIKKWNG